VFIEWVTGEGLMTVRRWSLKLGYTQHSRAYP
jgi:hypothetical protein